MVKVSKRKELSELEGQRSLLNLPDFTMDLHSMLKISGFFSELAELQYRLF